MLPFSKYTQKSRLQVVSGHRFLEKKPSWMICNIHLHGDKNAKSCSWWETFCQIILAQRSQWIQAYSGTFFCSLC